MKNRIKKTLTRYSFITALIVLLCSTAFASQQSPSQKPDPVKLTVQSGCASVNVRLSTGETMTTPFQVIFTRGQSITIEALDSSAPVEGKSKKAGLITVGVRSADESLWSNAVPILISK